LNLEAHDEGDFADLATQIFDKSTCDILGISCVAKASKCVMFAQVVAITLTPTNAEKLKFDFRRDV